MDQQKIGEFLKELRKEKGLTQEELAEKFYTSSRTVSRWETGKNMPELTILIELADFYDIDIRELIDGERKSENMDKETKDTLLKVAEYAEEDKTKIKKRFEMMIVLISLAAMLMIFSYFLFSGNNSGLLYGVFPHNILSILFWIIHISVSIMVSIVLVLFLETQTGKYINKIDKNKHKTIYICWGFSFIAIIICLGLFDKTYGCLYAVIANKHYKSLEMLILSLLFYHLCIYTNLLRRAVNHKESKNNKD